MATLTDKLESVLEQEYHALLSGSLDQIETLGREKLGLLERMSELSVRELESFITFRDRLFRNQNLAQSAIAGMRNTSVSRQKRRVVCQNAAKIRHKLHLLRRRSLGSC